MQDEAPDGQPQVGGDAGPPAPASPPEPTAEMTPVPVAERPLEATPSPGPAPATAAVALSAAAAPRPSIDIRNEAIPAVPPEAGTGPVGSIPAAHARAVWSRVQASNWRLFLIRFLCAGLAVVVTVAIVPGLGFVGWSWGQFTRIAIIFGLLNATVKPLLQFLVLRFIFSTYGIVVVVINALLLLLLAAILDDTFEVYRPVSLVMGGLVVGILGLIFETLLGATPPVLDRDYKERNGLR
jgi:putative membrane protein